MEVCHSGNKCQYIYDLLRESLSDYLGSYRILNANKTFWDKYDTAVAHMDFLETHCERTPFTLILQIVKTNAKTHGDRL